MCFLFPPLELGEESASLLSFALSDLLIILCEALRGLCDVFGWTVPFFALVVRLMSEDSPSSLSGPVDVVTVSKEAIVVCVSYCYFIELYLHLLLESPSSSTDWSLSEKD